MINTLFFLEDPGAVSFIRDIFPELKKLKLPFKILTQGVASKMLKEDNFLFEEVFSKDYFEDYLKKNNIGLIISGTSQNPKSLSHDLIDCAKGLNIDTVAFIDSPADYNLRFRGESNNALKHAPDKILVPDKEIETYFKEMGFDDKNILITGYPNYEKILNSKDDYIKKDKKALRKKFFNKKIDIPLILFIDEHLNSNDPRMFKSKEYNFTGRETLRNRNEVIASEVLNILADIKLETFFVVRMHPKSSDENYKLLNKEIDNFNSKGNIHELILASDLVIGMTSNVLMETYILGKEVISLMPRNIEKEWVSSIFLDSISCALDYDEAKKLIKKVLIDNKSTLKKKFIQEKFPIKVISDFIKKYHDF